MVGKEREENGGIAFPHLDTDRGREENGGRESDGKTPSHFKLNKFFQLWKIWKENTPSSRPLPFPSFPSPPVPSFASKYVFQTYS